MLDRDSWPVWCAQNGVSPDARSVVANGDPDRKKHTYAQRAIVGLCILALYGMTKGAIVSLLRILKQVVQWRLCQVYWRFWCRPKRRV